MKPKPANIIGLGPFTALVALGMAAVVLNAAGLLPDHMPDPSVALVPPAAAPQKPAPVASSQAPRPAPTKSAPAPKNVSKVAEPDEARQENVYFCRFAELSGPVQRPLTLGRFVKAMKYHKPNDPKILAIIHSGSTIDETALRAACKGYDK